MLEQGMLSWLKGPTLSHFFCWLQLDYLNCWTSWRAADSRCLSGSSVHVDKSKTIERFGIVSCLFHCMKAYARHQFPVCWIAPLVCVMYKAELWKLITWNSSVTSHSSTTEYVLICVVHCALFALVSVTGFWSLLYHWVLFSSEDCI